MLNILILICIAGMIAGWSRRNRTWGKVLLTLASVLLLGLAIYRIFNPHTYRDDVHQAYSRHFLAAGLGVGEQLKKDFSNPTVLVIDYERNAPSPFEKATRSFIKGLSDSLKPAGKVTQHRIPEPIQLDSEGETFAPMETDPLAELRNTVDADVVILATGIPRTFTLEDLKKTDGTSPAFLLMRETSPEWQARLQRGEIYGILKTKGREHMNVEVSLKADLTTLYTERFTLMTRE